MVGRREYLVEIIFFEQGFLGLEAVFVQQGGKNRVACNGFFRKSKAVPFFEVQQVGIEEPEADSVAGKAPIAFASDRLFKL